MSIYGVNTISYSSWSSFNYLLLTRIIALLNSSNVNCLKSLNVSHIYSCMFSKMTLSHSTMSLKELPKRTTPKSPPSSDSTSSEHTGRTGAEETPGRAHRLVSASKQQCERETTMHTRASLPRCFMAFSRTAIGCRPQIVLRYCLRYAANPSGSFASISPVCRTRV